MNLIEFLTLEIRDKENILPIATYVFETLDKIKKCHFCTDDIHILHGVVSKFEDVRSFYIGDEEGGSNIIKLANDLIYEVEENGESSENERRKSSTSDFNRIYSELVNAYRDILLKINITTFIDDFDFLYNPNFSDKEKAKKLINEAIEIITNASGIDPRHIKLIKSHLENALRNLERESPNWNMHFGNIQQLIIILGALGSIASGATGFVALKQANEKLIQATEIVATTSVNNIVNLKQENIVNITYENTQLYEFHKNTFSQPQAFLPVPRKNNEQEDKN